VKDLAELLVGDAEDLVALLVDDEDAHDANEDVCGAPLSNIPNASGTLSRSMYILPGFGQISFISTNIMNKTDQKFKERYFV
jgi:hypothetical protein